MPENAFLELCRDTERSESEHAFQEAGLDALNAAGQGTLATLFALSGSPYAALGAVVSAAFAGVASGEACRPSAKAGRARHKAPPRIPCYRFFIRQHRRAWSSQTPSHRAV